MALSYSDRNRVKICSVLSAVSIANLRYRSTPAYLLFHSKAIVTSVPLTCDCFLTQVYVVGRILNGLLVGIMIW